MYVWEGGEERQTRGESYPGMEQFVTLEWLLSYTGGPLIAGEFSGRRVGNREGLGVAERGSEVTAYSSPGSVSVSRADGPAERERERRRGRQEAKKGVVGKSGSCQGSVFLCMLIKSAGKISV